MMIITDDQDERDVQTLHGRAWPLYVPGCWQYHHNCCHHDHYNHDQCWYQRNYYPHDHYHHNRHENGWPGVQHHHNETFFRYFDRHCQCHHHHLFIPAEHPDPYDHHQYHGHDHYSLTPWSKNIYQTFTFTFSPRWMMTIIMILWWAVMIMIIFS